MNAPTTKTILAAFPGSSRAENIRRIIQEYNKTENVDHAFHQLNDALRGYGVEIIRNMKNDVVCWYVNMGDAYATTAFLAHNKKTGVWSWHIGSWGDWIEAQEKQGEKFN